MIVLQRKAINIGTEYARIYVGDDVIIHLSELDRGSVRIGISAPRDVPVWRGELLSGDQRKAIEIAAGFSTDEHQHDLGGEA